MTAGIRLNLTPDQVCAVNNALRREIEIQQRLQTDRTQIGVDEYIRHLESALQIVTGGWERAFNLPVVQR
ncbi:hypothetical protein [Aquamicrobium sp.]|uniref:hypothetical protein n=1 Tax=Aquamicrobium sp. TaxID=1872579 RepID=UPI002587DF8D|nr:hypothetical protein [Aquamicrobium sp.]MCK9549613.1 hypothetical protein [Aquamicrobium sp.]